jgi:hypothetical protein
MIRIEKAAFSRNGLSVYSDPRILDHLYGIRRAAAERNPFTS